MLCFILWMISNVSKTTFLLLCHESACGAHNLTGKCVLEGEGQGLAAGRQPPMVFQCYPRRTRSPFYYRWFPTEVSCSDLSHPHWEYLERNDISIYISFSLC